MGESLLIIEYNNHVENLINQLKSYNSDLKKAEIEGILYIVSNERELTNNELVRRTGLTKEILKQFKSSLSNLLEPAGEDNIKLNELGKETLSKLELKPYAWSLVTVMEPKVESELKELRIKHNMDPKREFDQFFATEQTSVAKATIIKEKGMLQDKNIALLGDDDLVSITLGKMFPHYNRITVYDVDNRILDPINSIATSEGLKNISTKTYDARKPLKSEDIGKYDVVMIDPPYTPAGIALFLRRSIELLGKPNDSSGKYIFLCYNNSLRSPEKSLKIQEIIQQYNLLIEDKIDKFNRYYGAEAIGSTSSMYVLKITPQTRAYDNYLDEAIYTFENRKEEKFPYVDHFTFKVYDVPHNVITNKKALLKATQELCDAHRLKVIDTKITEFKPHGLTITFVLGSSNLLVHTWPEMNSLHIDLITCTPIANKDSLLYNVATFYGTKSIEMRKIE